MSEIIYIKVDETTKGVRTEAQVLAKIAQIDAIIDSLMNTALISVTSGNIQEYEINTGQTKNRVVYSEADQIHSAIDGYEKIRQWYVNKLSPSAVRFVPNKNFRG